MNTSRAAPAIAPFWSRIPKFFAWPFQFGPMIYISCLSLGAILIYVAPLLGRLIYVAIWFAFFRYAMTVLVQTARGNIHTENTDLHLESGDNRPLKQAVYVVISFGLLFFLAVSVGPVLAILFGLWVSLTLPAAVMIIAMEDSLFDALNPLRVFSLMGSIGLPYLLLTLFLLLLQGGDVIVFNLIGPIIPDFIEYPVITFISMYFFLVMYNMMGYVVYQYHEKLGYGIDKSFEENDTTKKIDPNMSPVDRAIAERVAEGDIAGAIAALQDDMRYERNDIAKNQKLHKLFLTLGEADKTLPHAEHLLGLLANAKQAEPAYDLLLKIIALKADFSLPYAALVLPLAEIAVKRRNAAFALALLGGFPKKHPNHADVPAVFLLGAKILAEHKNDEKQAIDILRALILRFPDSPPAAEGKVYLSVIEKTRAAMEAARAPKP